MIQVTGLFNSPNRSSLYQNPVLKPIIHLESQIVCDVQIVVDDVYQASFPIFINKDNLVFDSNIVNTYDCFMQGICKEIINQISSQDYSCAIM